MNKTFKLTAARTASFAGIAILSAVSVAAQTAVVPSQYQSLYNSIKSNLDTFSTTLHSEYNGTRSNVVYSADLLCASSENGTAVLDPNYMTKVNTQLQELQALGVSAITVNVGFPTLYAPSYSSQSQYQQMLTFYTNLATEIHGRGLKLIVENHEAQLNPVSGQSNGNYAATLSWTQYVAARSTMAAEIATQLRPEYMVTVSEPDTQAAVSGQKSINTVSGATQLVTSTLSAVRAAGATSVEFGAGAGSWQQNFTDYIDAFAALQVNYIDVHIYPVNKNFLTNALAAADIAHKAGKQVASTEAWLYKVSDSELGTGPGTVWGRDPFSFWAPLDSEFMQLLVASANYKQFLFISPFWSNYFSAYVPYTGSATASLSGAYGAAMTAMSSGQFSPSGNSYENAILLSPDKTAPTVPAAPATQTGGGAVKLTWSPTTDNVGVAGYQVIRDGAMIGTTSSTSYGDSAVKSGQKHTYALKAFDAAGNVSPQSAPATVTVK